MTRADSFEREALPHLDAVYRFALRLTGSAADAEDLVQETFLRAYRNWHQYEPGTSAKSWLFTICRNTYLRQQERGRRHERVVSQILADVDAAADGPGESHVFAPAVQADPEGLFFNALIDRTILEAIDRLPQDFREVVLLSDLEGLPYAEIAGVLDVPIGTVKSRLFRGRRLLQKVLYEYAVENGYIPAREP